MRRPLLVLLAIFCVFSAWLLPVTAIDERRAANISELKAHAAEEAAQLRPEDDTYVEYINTPYPLSGGSLLRVLLIADGFLFAGLALVQPRRGKPARRGWLASLDSRDKLAVATLTLAAAALRFTGSGRDLWIDEITTLIRHARGPAADVFLQATSSNNHLLNSLFAHWSITLFGEKEWALRLPAMLFGTATIPVFYTLLRRFSPRWETLLATSALAFSYHHVFFSQDARGYTGMLFGGLLATLALIEALDTGSMLAWGIYAFGSIICVCSVLLGIVILAAHFLAVSLFRRKAEFYAAFALACWAILHAYAFVIADILGFILGEYKRPEVGWRFSGELLQVILGGLHLGSAAIPALAAGGAIVAAGTVSYFRQDKLFTALLLLPELLVFAAVAGLNAAVFPRFFIYALPVAIALLARGIRVISETLPAPLSRAAVPVSFAGLAVASVLLLRTWWLYPKQDYSGARRFIESRMKAGDAVIATGIVGEGYRHYWPQAEVVNRVSILRAKMTGAPRVWLLYGFPRDMEKRRPKIMNVVRDSFEELESFRGMVGDGEVRVCLYPPSGAGHHVH